MDKEDLAPLIEFIGKKFDQVDQRFEGMDRRFDQMATKEEVRAQQAETRRHMGVLVEAARDDIRQVAEGLVGVEGRLGNVEHRLDRFEQKVETEFTETRAMIRVSYTQLDERIQSLEHNYATLNDRVARLESRLQ
jgi:predicted RNase H-like nuclease (RuvC/YqgF family)